MLVKDCDPLSASELPGSDVFTRAPHPRTAVGLSRDRKTLYFVVADGRRTGVPGMTLAQLASFMAERLHVCSAINFDGGGSTAMWVGDHIVNRPSDGVERKVADHLAVVALADIPSCNEPSLGSMTSDTTTSNPPPPPDH
jgi:exopolysaccharide biosynthesis protein